MTGTKINPSSSSRERVKGTCSALTTRLGVVAVVAMLFVCVLMAGSRAGAQVTGQGSIEGTVMDSTGAVVVGAHLTITNVATGVSRSSGTNSTGYFEVDSLNPGVYNISAASPGFETLLREGITLQVADRLRVPLSLKPGTVTKTITVTADASLLNTEGGSTGQVLTAQQLTSLPVSGMNPAYLIDLTPGVNTIYSQVFSSGGTLNWNGVSHFGANGLTFDNEFSLDGAPNMEGPQNGINPTPDELADMKIDTTGFDASIGHTMGVNITQTTKSGTNSLHGTVRENYSNQQWNAMNHFGALAYAHYEASTGCNGSTATVACQITNNTYGIPPGHENNDDFAVGGPVIIPKVFNGRNKLFFFISMMDDINDAGGISTAFVPTTQERTGDFSDLPVPAQTNIPAAFTAACPGATYFGQYQIYDPFSVKNDANGIPRRTPFCGNVVSKSRLAQSAMVNVYNSLLPTPNYNTSSVGTNLASSHTNPQTYRTFTGRGDYAPSQSDHVFARYTRADYTSTNTGLLVGAVDTQKGPRWIDTASVGWNHVFSASTNLDVTVGGNNFRTHCCFYPGYDALQPSTLGLPSYASAYAATGQSTMPIISVSNYQQVGTTDNATQIYRMLAFRANLTHVQGMHTIRAGGEFRFQHTALGAQGNTAGTYTFNDQYTQENNGSDTSFSQTNTGLSYAAFLMGVQSTAAAGYTPPYSLSSPYYAFYAGDTWRVTPKLTIVPGIRYEFEYGVTEKHNGMIVGWDFNASQPIAAEANTAYQAVLAGLGPTAQTLVMPPSLTIQGGPMYGGVNGAPTNQWNNSYRFLPRISGAYQLTSKTVIRAGWGLFFDTMNAELNAPTQQGFSSSTSVPSSTGTEYGSNFVPVVSGGPVLAADPFPANASGARFAAPVGSAAGAMYYLGSGPGVRLYDHNTVPARADRGLIGVQHQFGNATMLEVNWIGSLATRIGMNHQHTYVPSRFYSAGTQPASTSLLATQVTNPFALANFSDIATSNPAEYNLMSLNSFFTQKTIALSALVRTTPAYTSTQFYESIGESKFQEIQVTINHRYSQGLSLMGTIAFNHQSDRDYFANGFDPSPSWEASNTSVPVRFTSEAVYSLPLGRGRAFASSGWKSAVLGGFQLSGIYEAQTGQLLNFGNLFYIGNIKASDIKIKHPGYYNNLGVAGTNGTNYVQWLNPGNVVATHTTLTTTATATSPAITTTTCSYTGTGFVTDPNCQPTSQNMRVFPTRIRGVRAMGLNAVNVNLQRTFRIREGMTLMVRGDAYNALNHQVLDAPAQLSPTNAQFGWVTSEKSGNGNGNGRFFLIGGKLQF